MLNRWNFLKTGFYEGIKLGDVTLDWSELRASDLSGRARAFQSMVGGGMPVTNAVAIAGLMVDD